MNGAEALVRTLIAGEIDTCFTNPGTSEMHIVGALDKISGIRCVLGLFEGVVTSAADGYARMAGKPACTLLHLGPGLANGLANLHNASRAHVPIVNIVGQHSTDHLQYDTPLKSDIDAIARPFSNWVRTSQASVDLSLDLRDAIVASRTPPGQIATLIVPANVAWSEALTSAKTAFAPSFPSAPLPPSEQIRHAESMLRSGSRTAILLAGATLFGKGLEAAGRIAAATNAKLLAPYPFTRMQRGTGVPVVERMHYMLNQAVDQLKEFRQIILVGSQAPVAYFAYPGVRSVLSQPDCEIHTLALPNEDCIGALEALACDFSSSSPSISPTPRRPPIPAGELNSQSIAAAIGALLPQNAIVVDESMTSGRGLMAATKRSPNHDWLANTGGSIGIAMPLAVGAAIACPDRRVLCLSADGSGMYTAQALWTMARESLNITTVIFANRAYAVLRREFAALGIGDPGPRASNLFDIGHPDLDWVSLAKGMGVPGTRANSLDIFVKSLQQGFAADGPTLIEVGL